MPRMPGVPFHAVPNCTTGGQQAYYGVVLHIMEGTLAGTDSWFKNPSAQASAHFGVGKDGSIIQWVDTNDRAWAQADGNRTWLSIEHEGHAGDSLTAAQIEADGKILKWMHETHGIAYQVTDSTTGRGVGWHGMGGAAWGGHYDCPGTPIKNQRAAVIAAAEGEDMPLTSDDVEKVVNGMASYLGAPKGLFSSLDNPTTTDDSLITYRGAIWDAGKNAFQANNAAQKLVQQVAQLTATVNTLAGLVGKNVDTAAVVKAVQDAIKDTAIDVNIVSKANPEA